MKKSLLALAVLASAAGAANAASSVTMYGRVDVGYEDWKNNNLSVTQGNASKETEKETESRFGIKGQEDLGNGLAATFQLEGRFDASTGSYSDAMFARESTVGLKGNFGHVRFGRSKSAMEIGLGDFNVGERVGSTDPYLSSTRHSNAAFYDYEMNGFKIGGDVTTKGGASTLGASEGVEGSKVSYGLHANYTANNFAVGAAYQADRGQTSSAVDKEWGVAASYTFNPVTIGATYAAAKNGDVKGRTWGAYVTGNVTSADSLYVKYQAQRIKDSVMTTTKTATWGIGGAHALSKRTSVYADVARIQDKVADEKYTGYSVGLRHAF